MKHKFPFPCPPKTPTSIYKLVSPGINSPCTPRGASPPLTPVTQPIYSPPSRATTRPASLPRCPGYAAAPLNARSTLPLSSLSPRSPHLHQPQDHRPRKHHHRSRRRPQTPRSPLPGQRVHPRGVAPQVPRPHVRQLAVAVQERGVGPDLGVVRPEGAVVGVARDEVRVVEPVDGGVVEVLRCAEVLVGEDVLGDPDGGAGEAGCSSVYALSLSLGRHL